MEHISATSLSFLFPRAIDHLVTSKYTQKHKKMNLHPPLPFACPSSEVGTLPAGLHTHLLGNIDDCFAIKYDWARLGCRSNDAAIAYLSRILPCACHGLPCHGWNHPGTIADLKKVETTEYQRTRLIDDHVSHRRGGR